MDLMQFDSMEMRSFAVSYMGLNTRPEVQDIHKAMG